jgi:hypothetical protein
MPASFAAIPAFLGETTIRAQARSGEVQTPVIIDEASTPVPMKPSAGILFMSAFLSPAAFTGFSQIGRDNPFLRNPAFKARILLSAYAAL